jgi:hypothetical protein
MGIDVHVYTIYGVKTEWNDALVDDLDDVYEKCPLDIVLDGMGGNYMVLGKQLFGSPNFRWNDGDGDAFTEITIEQLSEIEAEYRQEFAKWFPAHVELLNQPFKILSFTHYS